MSPPLPLELEPENRSSTADHCATVGQDESIGRLLFVLLASIVVAASLSHAVARWVRVETKTGRLDTVGEVNAREKCFLAGSSLASYGLSWPEIARILDLNIKVWGVAGSSPFEWEQFQSKASDARTTFLVVSSYDLDESIVCDFRADLVPFTENVKALFAAGAGWSELKRTVSQYSISSLRTLFPTVGRSRAIMGRIHERVGLLLKHRSNGATENPGGPRIDFQAATQDEYERQKVSDWAESKKLLKMTAMQASFRGQQSFNGVKRSALIRMLNTAKERPNARVCVVVLPVSGTYSNRLLSRGVRERFEESLGKLQEEVTGVKWIRLDQIDSLARDETFCDLVHMNYDGQAAATRLFLESLHEIGF